MPSEEFEAGVRRAVKRRHRRLAEDLVRLREDAGVSRSRLALSAGVDRRYLDRIEAGDAHPSFDTYQRLATILGADLTMRLYPTTGPTIHDRWQAPILELLLRTAHARWARFTELAVHRPGRGWIDAALHDAAAGLIIATEIESELRRLEQRVRWHGLKADSLPSWSGWHGLRQEPTISRLLILRRTRATQATVAEYSRQLRIAYPAHPADALAAISGTDPWPGAALLWAVVDRDGARFASTR